MFNIRLLKNFQSKNMLNNNRISVTSIIIKFSEKKLKRSVALKKIDNQTVNL